MAYSIISPPYSFVRFSDNHIDDTMWMENQCPGSEIITALPIQEDDDLQFQFIVQGTESEIDALCAAELATDGFIGIKLGPLVNTPITTALSGTWGDTIDTFNVEKVRISATQLLFFIPGPFPGILETVGCGECFQLFVHFTPDSGATYFGRYSNPFYRDCDCYSSVIEYYSEIDEQGFIYCASPNIKNRVRLNLYPKNPSYPEEESMYRYSDGTVKVTKSTVRKLYDINADLMPEWMTDCLRAVYMHDQREIESARYTGGMYKEGAFELEPVDYLDYPLFKVSFKIGTEFYLQKNSNCGECTIEETDITADDHNVSGLLDATVYVVNLLPLVDSCCSEPQFSVTLTAAPGRVTAWNLSGHTLTFTTGTLPVALGFPLFTYTATCGISSDTGDITGTT